MSYALRHSPQSIGLTLDAQGWANIEELRSCAATQGRVITLETVLEVVATCEKQRYAISEDGLSIRANQGHSLKTVDLKLRPEVPPQVLYHGTASRFIDSIRMGGLLPGRRQHVHLSEAMDTAVSVGTRHGTPVVLVVQAAAMRANGHVFFKSQNGVWLTEAVPAKFLKGIP